MIISNEILYRRFIEGILKVKAWLINLYKGRCRKIALANERECRAKFRQKLQEAQYEWELALKMQNEYTDEILIDFGAYNIKAAEMKFRYLTNLAKHEGMSLLDNSTGQR